jgi:hypothetical protein
MTSKEIAAMFPPLSEKTINTRASREGWREIRDQAREFLRLAGDKQKFPHGGGPATDCPPKKEQTPFILPIPLAPKKNYHKRSKMLPPDRRLPEPIGVHPPGSRRPGQNIYAGPTMSDEQVLARAIEIQSADTFRTRVIQANEKALKVLEAEDPQTVGEVDRFAEALTKVERIGARTYGYDRESDRPIVNIGVLTAGAGSEYD